jgi:dTDP-4-dehydrorhamnose reductase
LSILLLGAAGQVGREITELAACQSVPLLNITRQQVDLRNPEQLRKVVQESRPSAVINAAAYTAVDKAESDEMTAFAVNGHACEVLAETCSGLNVPLLHFSTDYVFDGLLGRAYKEEDAPQPTGIYGHSKLHGERAIQARWPRHVILRISWVFGKYGANFVKTILRLAREREELRVVNDQWGCPCAARHVAAASLDIAQDLARGKDYYGVFHYADHPATTWHGFAEKIISTARELDITLMARDVIGIPTTEYPTPAKRPAYAVLDSEKLRNVWGIPARNWSDCLPEVLRAV